MLLIVVSASSAKFIASDKTAPAISLIDLLVSSPINALTVAANSESFPPKDKPLAQINQVLCSKKRRCSFAAPETVAPLKSLTVLGTNTNNLSN
jgi:hypothetical protein